MGTLQYSYGPTAYSILRELNSMDAAGKAQSKIQKKIDQYMQKYSCANLRNSVLDKKVFVLKPGYYTYVYKAPYAKPIARVYIPPETKQFFGYALENYRATMEMITENFRMYMQMVRKLITVK